MQKYCVSDALTKASQYLQHTSDTALLDSQVLLAYVLNKQINFFYTWPETLLSSEDFSSFWQLVNERLQGKPIAYLTGEKEFWSLPFYVSPATLIPRPDTEILVETLLSLKANGELHCLDLGTGTGAIALSLASERSQWKIDAIDFSEEAVALAQKNKQRHQLNNVSIFQSDWFSKIENKSQYQVIVSNPPYIDPSDKHLSEGDVQFEPLSALVAAEKGLADLAFIIENAKQYLSENGLLMLEHGFEQAQSVQQLFQQNQYHDIQTIKDYSGNDRITFATINSFNNTKDFQR